MSHRRSSVRGCFLAACVAGAVLGAPLGALALLATSSIHRALFHFDEGAGAFTADAVSLAEACLGASYAQPCVANATSPAWTSGGRFGSALAFDGVNDTLTFPDSDALDWSAANNQVVIEAWVKPARAGTILSKGTNYRLAIDAAGNLSFSYQDIRKKFYVYTSPFGTGQGAALTFGEWHWISVSLGEDQNVLEMRTDGGRNDKLILKGRSQPDPKPNTAPLTIGSFGGTSDFFGGVVDELRVSITPDAGVYFGGYPNVGSDRGVLFSRVEFSPASGPDFIELFRPDLGDGAPPLTLYGLRIYEAGNSFYEVPFSGTGCQTGDGSCYLVSRGETVRIWLNGSGYALDTASETFSEWHTSNCPACTRAASSTSSGNS
ncbi:MAG: LamG-like jellyroll fold domain-containing protein, partial [candidate division NC10 bacterium]